MERDERATERSLSPLGKKVYRLAGIRWCGTLSRMTADYCENGQVVMRLFSLISATRRRFGGSLLRAPMDRRMSTFSRAHSSSNGIVVRQQRQLASSTSS